MLKHICMSNGGSYSNVATINDKNTSDLSSEKIEKLIKSNDFLYIQFDGRNSALIRTACISSINF